MQDEGKKEEEKFEFDATRQALEYISLDQARVLAIRHARDNRESHGRRYSRQELVWEVLNAEEGEDYCQVRLSYQPARSFQGEPGVELSTIDKTGPITLRQILSEPRQRRAVGFPSIAAGLVVLVCAVAAILFLAGVIPSGSSEEGGLSATAVSVAVLPSEPAQLVSVEGDVTLDLEADSIDGPLDLRYQALSGQAVPPLPQGYVSSQKVFDISLTSGASSAAGPIS